MLYKILQHFHSGWAYLTILAGVLFLLIIGFYALNKRARDKFVSTLSLVTVIAFHVQLVTGAILYFISPKVESGITLYTLEHPIMMFTSVLLITVANSQLKKQKIVGIIPVVLSVVAIICMFLMIPWADWSN